MSNSAGMQILAAAIATYSAGILFRSGKKQLPLVALLGGAGWAVYLLIIDWGLLSLSARFL